MTVKELMNFLSARLADGTVDDDSQITIDEYEKDCVIRTHSDRKCGWWYFGNNKKSNNKNQTK